MPAIGFEMTKPTFFVPLTSVKKRVRKEKNNPQNNDYQFHV